MPATGGQPGVIAALLFGTLLWVGALGLFLRTGTASIFHPASYYLFFHGLVFTARPWLGWLLDYRFIYHAFQFAPSAAERVQALLVADAGLIAFMGAVLWTGSVRLVLNPAPAVQALRQRVGGRALGAAALLCAPVALLSLASLLRGRLADAGTMVMDPTNGISINTVGNGYLAEANAMLIPLVVLCAWRYRFRWWSLVPFCAFSGARLLIGGARWTFLLAAASLALAYLYDRRARWMRPPVLALAAGAMLLFTAVGQDRARFASWFADVGTPAAAQSFALRPLEDENYANQEFLEYLVRAIPARTGTFGYFLDNLQLLTEPVPRVLWPNKPIGPPLQRYRLFDYGVPIGMTMSLPGEGWAQGGWPGVIAWCGLWGWLFGRAHARFARSAQTEFQVAAYLLLLPLSIQFFRDGTLITLARFSLFYLIPLSLWWIVARFGGRRVVIRRGARTAPA